MSDKNTILCKIYEYIRLLCMIHASMRGLYHYIYLDLSFLNDIILQHRWSHKNYSERVKDYFLYWSFRFQVNFINNSLIFPVRCSSMKFLLTDHDVLQKATDSISWAVSRSVFFIHVPRICSMSHALIHWVSAVCQQSFFRYVSGETSLVLNDSLAKQDHSIFKKISASQKKSPIRQKNICKRILFT